MSKSSQRRLKERRLGSKMSNYTKCNGIMPESGHQMSKPGSGK